MKKSYLQPSEKIVELGAEADLMITVVSAETTTEKVDLENPTGGEGLIKSNNLWDEIW